MSDYTVQPPGLTAAENLLMDHGGYAGLEASIESAYRVGAKVVDEIVTNWDVYKNRLPPAPPAPALSRRPENSLWCATK